jgi:hypothetical protein
MEYVESVLNPSECTIQAHPSRILRNMILDSNYLRALDDLNRRTRVLAIETASARTVGQREKWFRKWE